MVRQKLCHWYITGIMPKKAHVPPPDDAQLLVLALLQDGAYSWDELKAATEFEEDFLGDVLAELLTQKEVRTEMRGKVRVYRLPATRA